MRRFDPATIAKAEAAAAAARLRAIAARKRADDADRRARKALARTTDTHRRRREQAKYALGWMLLQRLLRTPKDVSERQVQGSSELTTEDRALIVEVLRIERDAAQAKEERARQDRL